MPEREEALCCSQGPGWIDCSCNGGAPNPSYSTEHCIGTPPSNGCGSDCNSWLNYEVPCDCDEDCDDDGGGGGGGEDGCENWKCWTEFGSWNTWFNSSSTPKDCTWYAEDTTRCGNLTNLDEGCFGLNAADVCCVCGGGGNYDDYIPDCESQGMISCPYDPIQPFQCVYNLDDCPTGGEVDPDGEISPDPYDPVEALQGCMDPEACNYEAWVTSDTCKHYTFK